MLLSDYIDSDELIYAINLGYVDVKTHPDFPELRMYTYSRTAQWDGFWPDAVRKSRGLIANYDTGEIVAFCMPKFFNKSEHDNGKDYASPLPDEWFRVYDKMDGSMGTVYHYADQWHVATKGSFLSDQAVKATEMLRAADTRYLSTDKTYVVEIIYPDNRIVVDYGARHDLVLLTSYFVSTGDELLHPVEWRWTGFSYVEELVFHPETFRVGQLENLTKNGISSGTEAEGFVVRFDSGLRVKLKFDEYLALHKILTNCTERTIWEALHSQTDLAKFRENVPDEFDEWVARTVWNIQDNVEHFMIEAENWFMNIVYKVGVDDRKAFALEAAKLNNPFKSAVFMLYDGKSIRDLAFKQCYPSATKPFYEDDE